MGTTKTHARAGECCTGEYLLKSQLTKLIQAGHSVGMVILLSEPAFIRSLYQYLPTDYRCTGENMCGIFRNYF